jgi:hypothetical protein
MSQRSNSEQDEDEDEGEGAPNNGWMNPNAPALPEDTILVHVYSAKNSAKKLIKTLLISTSGIYTYDDLFNQIVKYKRPNDTAKFFCKINGIAEPIEIASKSKFIQRLNVEMHIYEEGIDV